MKRDIELIRDILFWMEKQFPSRDLQPECKPEFAQYDKLLIRAHCHDMWLSGLIRATDASADGGEAVILLGITPLGHDFIAKARDVGAWSKAKQWANSPLGSAALPAFIQALLSRISS